MSFETSAAAGAIIDAAKALGRTIVFAYGKSVEGSLDDMTDAIVVGECALKEQFAGSEIRVRIAALSEDGRHASRLFVNVCVNASWGGFVGTKPNGVYDILAITQNKYWPREVLADERWVRWALTTSLNYLVDAQSTLVESSLEATGEARELEREAQEERDELAKTTEALHDRA